MPLNSLMPFDPFPSPLPQRFPSRPSKTGLLLLHYIFTTTLISWNLPSEPTPEPDTHTYTMYVVYATTTQTKNGGTDEDELDYDDEQLKSTKVSTRRLLIPVVVQRETVFRR